MIAAKTATAAHTLKGMASVVCATPVQELSARLEEALKAPVKSTVSLKTEALVSPKAAEFYGKEGVGVEFSLPSTAAVNPAALEALKEEGQGDPDFVAGHSLGEYSALVASGVS